MNAHEMIKRYTHQVARRLPKNMRNDVRAELEALLSEELNEKSASLVDGQTPDEVTARELLVSFGSPADAALRYHAPQLIIETRDSRLFGKIAGVLLVSLFILAISVFLSEPRATAEASSAVAERIARDTTELALQILGALLVIFWLVGFIRRRFPNDNWNPKSLAPVRDPDKINRPLNIAAILFWAGGLTVLAAGPAELIAAAAGENAAPAIRAAFAYDSEFAAERAWFLWSLLAAAIALHLWQTIEGRRRRLTRILSVILTLAISAALFEIVLTGDAFASEPANQIMKLAMALTGSYGLIEVWAAVRHERAHSHPTPLAG